MKAKELGSELLRHLQTGVSYMIPLVTTAGLLMSIGGIFGGQTVENPTMIWDVVKMIGSTGLGFIVPMVSAFIAYSVADRPGLAPAFVTGLIAANMGTGFLGGIVTGLACGYLANLCKKIPVPDTLVTIKSLMIIPICVTTVVALAVWYIVGPPITAMTAGISAWLGSLSGINAGVLGLIIGAMMASDMGGPINKIAYTFGMAAFTDGNYIPSTIMLAAIAIPPTGMFLATLLNKKLYSDEERDNGKTAMVMGIFGITEGTIPFAIADPLRVIPSIIVGTATTCGLVGFFGIINNTTMSTYKAIPFVTNIPLYLVAIAVGSFVTAVIVNALKTNKYKKEHQEKTE